MKKIAIAATAACLLAAAAAPSGASAVWTANHKAVQENVFVQMWGTMAFHGEIGGVQCDVEGKGWLFKNSTTATLFEFGVDTSPTPVTDNCSVDAVLAFLGCTDVSQVTMGGLPWNAHATSTQTIALTTGTIQNHLHGGIFCPKTIQLTPGTVHITMTQSNTWTSGALSGELGADTSAGFHNFDITGSGSIFPSFELGVV